ncbi:unnamed protein product [Arabis nemorensis]|uniref:Uncharacterized protein n=1 Tax=Arabis nemorensis TaxID=586526 RepID=A0A565BEY3_9BRAS|nr:unnamed protein product [Arabis nemorensis]
MYFLDVFLVSFVLTVLPRPIVTARQRIADQIGEWGFAFFKGICTVAIFTLFHWLGEKLLADKDIFVALSCIFFFVHLRVIHEITDDFGIAQGFLIAGYTVLIAESPNLPHIIGFSAAFTVLLAIVNTPQPPYQPPYQEIEMDEAEQPPNSDDEYDDAPEQLANPPEDLEVGHEGPVIPAMAIPLQAKGKWAEAQNSKWKFAHTTETRCKLI